MVKTSGLEVTTGNKIGVELLQSPIPRELSLFVLSEVSWKTSLASLSLFEADLQLNLGEETFSLEMFVKSN